MGRDHFSPISLVIGLLGTAVTIIFSINQGADWKDFSLIGSGWVAAVFFSMFLWRASKIIEKNFNEIGGLTKEIGRLEERVVNLEEKLNRSHEISHYLATLNKTGNATPRATVATAVEINNPEW